MSEIKNTWADMAETIKALTISDENKNNMLEQAILLATDNWEISKAEIEALKEKFWAESEKIKEWLQTNCEIVSSEAKGALEKLGTECISKIPDIMAWKYDKYNLSELVSIDEITHYSYGLSKLLIKTALSQGFIHNEVNHAYLNHFNWLSDQLNQPKFDFSIPEFDNTEKKLDLNTNTLVAIDTDHKANNEKGKEKQKQEITKAKNITEKALSQLTPPKTMQELQAALNINADGVFWKNTFEAIKKYQEENKLNSDGIAGKNTLNTLFPASTVVEAEKAVQAGEAGEAGEAVQAVQEQTKLINITHTLNNDLATAWLNAGTKKCSQEIWKYSYTDTNNQNIEENILIEATRWWFRVILDNSGRLRDKNESIEFSCNIESIEQFNTEVQKAVKSLIENHQSELESQAQKELQKKQEKEKKENEKKEREKNREIERTIKDEISKMKFALSDFMPTQWTPEEKTQFIAWVQEFWNTDFNLNNIRVDNSTNTIIFDFDDTFFNENFNKWHTISKAIKTNGTLDKDLFNSQLKEKAKEAKLKMKSSPSDDTQEKKSDTEISKQLSDSPAKAFNEAIRARWQRVQIDENTSIRRVNGGFRITEWDVSFTVKDRDVMDKGRKNYLWKDDINTAIQQARENEKNKEVINTLTSEIKKLEISKTEIFTNPSQTEKAWLEDFRWDNITFNNVNVSKIEGWFTVTFDFDNKGKNKDANSWITLTVNNLDDFKTQAIAQMNQACQA